MRDVIAQNFLFHAAQCGADRADLRDDVDAVALVLNHAGKAAHLPFDAIQSLERSRLAVLRHGRYIPPRGIWRKAVRVTSGHDHHHNVENGVIDPVCGMTVNPHTAKHRAEHRGHTYYFCSAGCRTKFVSSPQKYLGDRQPETVPDGTIYTCPMHPEIRQVGPGACPICGMALEPDVASADAGPNPELVDMTRRFWIGLVLTVPVFALEMGAHIFGAHNWVDPRLSNYIQFASATPVVLWAGWPFFVRGWRSLVTRNLNMFTLIAMGTGVAYLYSLAATFVPEIFPHTFRGHSGVPASYFEAASVITILVLMGQVLELRAREATSGAIRALLDLVPKTARRVKDDGADEEVTLDTVQAGDRLRVRPGDMVPVDGIVLEGRSAVDESMVTGESMPVTKEKKSRVIGGTINKSGSFVMQAEKVGRDTLLSQIVQMVANAQRSRAPIQRLADQVSAWFVPAVIAIALVAFAGMGYVWSGATFRIRSGRSGQRADHRLPLRARPRDADVDHGRRRSRRAGRCIDQECGSTGTDGKGRHARRRQNRHAHRGQAEGCDGGAGSWPR